MKTLRWINSEMDKLSIEINKNNEELNQLKIAKENFANKEISIITQMNQEELSIYDKSKDAVLKKDIVKSILYLKQYADFVKHNYTPELASKRLAKIIDLLKELGDIQKRAEDLSLRRRKILDKIDFLQNQLNVNQLSPRY